jgi:hypothetical protein
LAPIHCCGSGLPILSWLRLGWAPSLLMLCLSREQIRWGWRHAASSPAEGRALVPGDGPPLYCCVCAGPRTSRRPGQARNLGGYLSGNTPFAFACRDVPQQGSFGAVWAAPDPQLARLVRSTAAAAAAAFQYRQTLQPQLATTVVGCDGPERGVSLPAGWKVWADRLMVRHAGPGKAYTS